MTRAFWVAAVSGALLTAVVVNRWADSRTDAATIVAVLIYTLLILALIDIRHGE